MRNPIETFSGLHAFRPECLRAALAVAWFDDTDDTDYVSQVVDEQAELLLVVVNAGTCPRCGGPYGEGETPSGSRCTRCRCIPICRLCSEHEAAGECATADVGPTGWPVDIADRDRELMRFRSHCRPGVLDLGADVLLTDDGVGRVVPPVHLDGWADETLDGWADETPGEDPS